VAIEAALIVRRGRRRGAALKKQAYGDELAHMDEKKVLFIHPGVNKLGASASDNKVVQESP
jgi:hypothetical protein